MNGWGPFPPGICLTHFACAAPDLYHYSIKTVAWTAKIELKGEASKKTFRMESLYPRPKMPSLQLSTKLRSMHPGGQGLKRETEPPCRRCGEQCFSQTEWGQ